MQPQIFGERYETICVTSRFKSSSVAGQLKIRYLLR